MRPVQGEIRFAMLLAGTSAMFGLASIALLALVLGQLIQHPHVWPWQPMTTAVACLAASLLLRLSAFNQSHYAAFRLETILRTDMAQYFSAGVARGYTAVWGGRTGQGDAGRYQSAAPFRGRQYATVCPRHCSAIMHLADPCLARLAAGIRRSGRAAVGIGGTWPGHA